MSKSDLLNFLKDINYVYNDCGMHDSVLKMLDDFEEEIRAKAIEEAVRKLYNLCYLQTWVKEKDLEQLAEQLKGE